MVYYIKFIESVCVCVGYYLVLVKYEIKWYKFI